MGNVTEAILSKVNSYNIFNYLLPGVIFSYMVKHYSTIPLKEDTNIIVSGFLLYFTGMILSRIGSIVVEPILKIFKCITFCDYDSFVKAEVIDKKLSILGEVNNTYRSVLSTFFAFSLLKGYEILLFKETTPNNLEIFIGCGAIFTIFLVSYIKQSRYLTQRVNIILSQPD